MAFKIYTKTGDKGKTSLIGGTKVPKNHLRIESYGTIDELNSFIGLLNDQLAGFPEVSLPGAGGGTAGAFNAGTSNAGDSNAGASNVGASNTSASGSDPLREIQDRLFTIGSSLACDPDKESKMKIPDLKMEDITWLENAIDQMDGELPQMKSFILPGGHVAVSTAHIVRCVCRRAERVCVRMQEEGLFIEPLVLQYINRLSDYFFTVARFVAYRLGVAEIPWKPRL
ncbi:MAG TPA: cob(I)yrinic acid a,c-diamide adenosyltransferase [Puia sp.]|nr:cob(I)yrinic acid a,c-diamide adenosyltransferase [Puia sp.]